MSVDHTKNVISAENISFAYSGAPVLKDITLTIHQGDYLGIVGPNGGGKTTLLKIMLGLLKPTFGSVKLFGSDCLGFKEWSKIGYVPQRATNFDFLFPANVFEVVAMGRYGKKGLLKWLDKSDHAIIEKSLRQVDMWEFKDRLIGELSSGQQQRVFIARALAGEPEVIFLDEPTVGVDVNTQEKFYALLDTLNKDLNLTLIIVSHDIHVIAKQATELACVNQTLVYYGEPEKFMEDDSMEKLYGKNARQIPHDHHV